MNDNIDINTGEVIEGKKSISEVEKSYLIIH